jgi:1,4-dihydroxy-2-naphthoyl-CoA hydrolase
VSSPPALSSSRRRRGGFAVQRTVRFQDVDAAGIVFFPRILEYFHDALLEFLAEQGQPVDAALRAQSWGLPLRHAEADFVSPLRFGDRIEVLIGDAELMATEVRVKFQVRLLPDGPVAAVGATRHVCVALPSFARAELSTQLRSVLSRLCPQPAP